MCYNPIDIQKIFIDSFIKYIEKKNVKMTVNVDFMEDQGFSFMEIQLKNDLIHRVLILRFRIYAGLLNNIIAELVQFLVEDENNNHIYLENYWKLKKGNKYRIVSLINQVEGVTFEERLKNYFEIVKDTLENELKSVVEGKEWIDLNYDLRDDYVQFAE